MNVMLISFLFPPYGGMAPLRSAYFAQYLAQCGWNVKVLTVRPSPWYPWRDDSLRQYITDKFCVYRISAGVLHSWKYRLTEWIRDDKFRRKWAKGRGLSSRLIQVLSPLSASEWMIHALIGACRIIHRERVDVLYSHGDPFTSNIVGWYVKHKFGIPWVMYMSDPLSFGSGILLRGEWRYRIDRFIERKCLEDADAIVVNCEQTLMGIEEHFAAVDLRKCHIITDGYDSNRYTDAIARRPEGKFRLVYTGTMYQGAREPYQVIDALQRLKESDIECLFVGGVDAAYRNYAERTGASQVVKFLGHQPHPEVIALQKGADLLLLLGWQGGYQVPGKLFEYVAARRPILVISNGRDAAAEYVKKLNRGCIVNNSVKEIEEAIHEHYDLWCQGRLDSMYDLQECQQFTWRNLAMKLSDVLRNTQANQ